MVSSLNPVNQEFINSLNQITARMNTTELQITSGVTMQQVSDNPDQVSELLQARASLSTSQQISTNLGMVTTEVNTGEQALSSATQLFDQVQTLAAEGATGTQTAASRATLAQQVQSLEQQMVGLANTNVQGRYIFAGNSDQTQPYTYDPTQPDPVSAYQGTPSTRVIQAPDGTTFPVALSAQQIFDSTDPTTNVFTAMNGLITGLQNNDQTAIQTSVGGLSKVSTYLNQQLAFYGTTQDKVTSATSFAQTQQTEIQAQISSLEDTNMSSAIETLTQDQTQQQAALGSKAQIPRQTLFDFLA